MASNTLEGAARARPTVFLSYASEDRAAAQRLRDALPSYGLEVWYDESDLVGGDAWDQKIRGQIRACDYFMPVISAHTEARHEGYFRREWRLAVERTLDMADDHVFLLPVAIDATAEGGARVPERFRAVQWLRVPDGHPTAALETLCRRLVSGDGQWNPPTEVARPAPQTGPRVAAGGASARPFPPFPREEPGQRVRFWFQVAGWLLQSAWAGFKRLPRWLRLLIYIWAIVVLLGRGCSSPHVGRGADGTGPSAAQLAKLKEIGAGHAGGWTPAQTAQLISEFAKDLPTGAGGGTAADAALLAVPFAAPAADAAAQKLANSVFTRLYGRLVIDRRGAVALAGQPLPDCPPEAAAAQGRAHHSRYVICGAVGGTPSDERLTVKIISVDDGSTLWSRAYPVAGADPDAIAAQASAKVPRSADD